MERIPVSPSRFEMLDVVKQDALFKLQRVRRREDGADCLAKSSVREYPSASVHGQLRREFDLLRAAGAPCALIPLEFTVWEGREFSLFQACHGKRLRQSIPTGGCGLEEFLALAQSLCRILAAFHAKDIVLCGFNTDAVLREEGGRPLTLADACFARGKSTCAVKLEEIPIGLPLAYVAPELIGRMESPLTRQADLYSLGVVCYELLTGRRPFEAADPAALIQSHLALTPPPLTGPAIAANPSLAALVIRLLSKKPEDRFDSVEEVLQECRENAGAGSPGGGMDARTVRDRVPPEQRPPSLRNVALQGREQELSFIKSRFESIESMPEMIFVEGEAGIGKTALVEDFRKILAERKWISLSGRFSFPGQEKPFGAWAEVLKGAAESLLLKSPAELDAWQSDAGARLGGLGTLICTIAPEWKALLQFREYPVGVAEDTKTNRIALSIHRLLECFATGNSPVTIVLDDLQWADSSSLEVLELLLGSPEPLRLIILATLRTQEEPVSAGLERLLSRLAGMRLPFHRLHLRALEPDDMVRMFRDVFRGRLRGEDELARQFALKTGGNPFFVREFFQSLLSEGVFRFDEGASEWTWNAAGSAGKKMTESVVGFLERRIGKLTGGIGNTVRNASWLGREFRLSAFCLITGADPETARENLAAAAANGLLALEPVPGRADADSESASGGPGADFAYQFSHDRILEACQASIPADAKAAKHLEIARIFRLKLAPRVQDEAVFDVVNHYNRAEALVEEPEERLDVARLNLASGRAAKHKGAFSQAGTYLDAGLRFLGPSPERIGENWKTAFELALALHEEGAEADFLNRRFESMHRLCDVILAHAGSPLQSARAYQIRIAGLVAEKRNLEAVASARALLARLGVIFPASPKGYHAITGFLSTRSRLSHRRIPAIASIPEIHDEAAKVCMRVFRSIYPPCYLTQPKLYPLIVFKHVQLSLKYGNGEHSPSAYAAFAIALCGMGDFERAWKLGEVALKLFGKFPSNSLKSELYFVVYGFLHPWRKPLKESLGPLLEGYQCGMAGGNLEYASYLATVYCLARLHSGAPLKEMEPEFSDFAEKVGFLKQERSIHLQSLLTQIVHDMRAQTPGTGVLQGPFYMEDAMLAAHQNPLDQNLVFHHHLARLMLSCILGDAQGAVAAAAQGQRSLEGAFGLYLLGVFHFYEALAHLDPASPQTRKGAGIASANLKKFRKWAKLSPENFQHKQLLLEAELLGRRGDFGRAAAAYEDAMSLSQAQGFLHETGLCQELAARFYFGRGMDKAGRYFLREAVHSFESWGSEAKIRQLQTRYPQHMAILSASSPAAVMSAPYLPQALDYLGILKSSQAISSEIRLQKLLQTMMQIMLEYAGGRKAFLILENQGRLNMEAEMEAERKEARILPSEPMEGSSKVPLSVVRFAARTKTRVVLADAYQEDSIFREDPYIQKERSKSVLAMPMTYQGKLLGVAYFENGLVSHVFTRERLEILSLLSGQAAISIANARYHMVQMEAQQAKINPHFLFNALSSIANLTVSDAKTAETAIVKLSGLYRYILTSSEGKLVDLGQELEVVRTYLLLEKLRFGTKLDFSVRTEGDVSAVRLPGLLIQPLVENGIRHGIAPKLEPGKVSVLAEARGGRCHITVSDDGEGEGDSASTSGTGFGLRSVRERLELAFGMEFSMSITRHEGFKVDIVIPIAGEAA